MLDLLNYQLITPSALIKQDLHGARAKCLQRLVRLDLTVPETVSLSVPFVRSISLGKKIDLRPLLTNFSPIPILSVRSSPINSEWGGPSAVLNIGMNMEAEGWYSDILGQEAARKIHLTFIKSFACDVMRLDDDIFNTPELTPEIALKVYEQEMEEEFPSSIEAQLLEVLRSMSREWQGTSARLLRASKGAPEDAGLGLVVQRMIFGIGKGESGAGVIQFIESDNGEKKEVGRYLPQSQGRNFLVGNKMAMFLTKDARGGSLEESQPKIFTKLRKAGDVCFKGLRDEMQIEFTLEGGKLFIIDAVSTPRSARASVEVLTRLAENMIITKEEAVLRIEPKAVAQLLHKQVVEGSAGEVIAHGIAASPGATFGKLVFSSMAAQAAASQGESCILVRRETSPEDIRGMHAASGVLTERGGNTSHAAVIARGLGLPCVSGVTNIEIDTKLKCFVVDNGRVFSEGDVVTLDGTSGEILVGELPLTPAGVGASFDKLMGWADTFRDIQVRANADTPQDVLLAKSFVAEGIGLCRTEHMFFEEERLTVLREAIFADNNIDRNAALQILLPMQRKDFFEIFNIMGDLPVCLRLFDPPLHEFLPSSRSGIQQMAEAMNLTAKEVQERIESLSEFNPMLGMRGVRLGITVPEIYDMQARAIFEAASEVRKHSGIRIVPEIMIPLVSAKQEVSLVKTRMDAVALEVSKEVGHEVEFKLGVMVETPRAALRAGDIAEYVTFLSFGTNDMTQMTYGLSRDDSGRFMSAYVDQKVFPEDPFHALDQTGVGELLSIACERGRGASPNLVLSVCGEHGGDPESISFCRNLGMDYVSCSPYRVPIARLAAAQIAINDKKIKNI